MSSRSTTLVLLSIFAISTIKAQEMCSSTSCTTGCTQYDGVHNACNWDIYPYDSNVSCQCQKVGGLQGNANVLSNCVACNQDNLAAHNLAYYQIWTVICDAYLSNGEAQAQSFASQPASDVVQAFSSQYLPVIQSKLCGGSMTDSSATTFTSSIPITSKSSSVSAPTTASTTSNNPQNSTPTASGKTGSAASMRLTSGPTVLKQLLLTVLAALI